jgi:osmotically-inducible protein OsmY
MSLGTLNPDQDLERRVSQYLLDRRMPGLRQLSVKAQGGIVTLRGKVRTFYEKQLCNSICRRVAGVIRLEDLVAVAEERMLAST